MGFIQPNLPVVDMAEWSKGTRAERVVPMMRHIAENGFGTPLIMPMMYGLKIVLYVLGAWLFAWSTKGIGDFTNVGGLVDGTDRVPKGCALHDAVRSRRSRLLLRTAGRALFPADGFTPLLVATRHRPAATLAPPGAADQGQQQDSVRRVALRRPARVALDRAGVRRQRANTRSAQRDRRAAAVADHRDPGGPGGARLARQGDLSGDSR